MAVLRSLGFKHDFVIHDSVFLGPQQSQFMTKLFLSYLPETEMDDALTNAYHRAIYTAETPRGSLCLRIGEPNAELAALLADRGGNSWAFITACNPRSRILSPEENARRTGELHATLLQVGYEIYPGAGCDASGDWPAEPSWLVLGIELPQAIELGRHFGQNAILAGGADGCPMLFVCGLR